MHTDDTAIDAWLGPVELTDEQRERFILIWDDVTDRYPDDQDSQSAALSAAVQQLLGDLSPTEAGREIARLTGELANARAAARAVALLEIDAGATESGLHRELGVTRMTLRSWLGKR